MEHKQRIQRNSLTIGGAIFTTLGLWGLYGDAVDLADTLFGLGMKEILFLLIISGIVALSWGISWFIVNLVDGVKAYFDKKKRQEQKRNRFEGIPVKNALDLVVNYSGYGDTFVSGSIHSKEDITIKAMIRAVKEGEITIAGMTETTHTFARIDWKKIDFIQYQLSLANEVALFVVTTDDGLIWQQIMLNMIDLRRLYGVRP